MFRKPKYLRPVTKLSLTLNNHTVSSITGNTSLLACSGLFDYLKSFLVKRVRADIKLIAHDNVPLANLFRFLVHLHNRELHDTAHGPEVPVFDLESSPHFNGSIENLELDAFGRFLDSWIKNFKNTIYAVDGYTYYIDDRMNIYRSTDSVNWTCKDPVDVLPSEKFQQH